METHTVNLFVKLHTFRTSKRKIRVPKVRFSDSRALIIIFYEMGLYHMDYPIYTNIYTDKKDDPPRRIDHLVLELLMFLNYLAALTAASSVETKPPM